VDNILADDSVLKRHERIGKSMRKAIIEAGLHLYTRNGYSNTVSVIEVPAGIDEKKLRQYMVDNFNVLIAGSFGYLEGKVIRIGHMGENAREDLVVHTLYSLQRALEHFGFKCKCDMAQCFLREIHSS
jgi:aspartate aminotransferase-like enzyme